MTRRFDVLLAGYYGFGNLGDELLAESAVSYLQKAGVKQDRIAILTATPGETSKKLAIQAFDRWKITEILKAMKKSRSLLLGGGGLFQDATSSRSCLYYWGLVSAAKLCGARPWAVGQSIGPLRSVFAEKLARNALASCVYRGVRDSKSLEQLKAWEQEGALAPDLVMGLKVKNSHNNGGALLVNLRPGYDGLAEAAARAAQRFALENGLLIKGVALSAEDEELLKLFETKKIIDFRETVLAKSVNDFENAAADCHYALGMRLHFIILSLRAGLKTCAVPYDPKVKSLALRYNIPMTVENCSDIKFSEPYGDAGESHDAERLLQAFKEGMAKALGEI